MKRIYSLLLVFLLLGFNTVAATPFSSHLPGGKNYLEPGNFDLNGSTLSNVDSIRVKPNTTYVIQFPPLGMLDFPYLEITSEGTVLVEGYAHEMATCETEVDYTYCVFETTDSEWLDVSLTAQGLAQYLDYFGMDGIQLEEGLIPTAYEPYQSGFVDANGPEFSGTATFVKAYYETISIETIIADHIVVVDDIDGDLTSQIVISNDTYTANMHQVGNYPVTLSATDSSGNTASLILTIMVKDEVAPDIIGPDNIVVDVDSPPSTVDLVQANYTAMDGHDGALTLSVTIDEYSSNQTVTGTYDLSLYSEDANGNATTRLITVTVADQSPPAMLNNENIMVYLSNPLTMDGVIANLTLSDNYDDPSLLSTTILTDNYTGNEAIPGSYSVAVIIGDSSGNNTHETLLIHVVDDVAPVISGPQSISVSYLMAPSMVDILSQLSVSDNVSIVAMSDVVIEYNEYENRSTQTGLFEIGYLLVDEAGNETRFTQTVTLLDDQAPVIYIDNYLVTVTAQATFQPVDALNMMIQNNELPESTYDIVTIEDDYTGNEKTPGTYRYHLQFIAADGMTYDKEFMIQVATSQESSMEPLGLIRPVMVYGTTFGFVIYIMKRQKK